MSEQSNRTRQRVNRFATALAENYNENDDLHIDVVDLLADCQHYCNRMEINFSEALAIATGHYEAEK